jgi:DNA-binding GntR family transcriptional regulator
LRLDTEFHAAFFRHCDNNYLRDSYERYVGKIAALRTHLAAKPKHTKLSLQEHEELLTACKDGDKPAISRILSAHIERTSNTYAADIDDIATADTRDSNGN